MMLATRSVRLRFQPLALARRFSSSPVVSHVVPSIRDITPQSSTEEFNARQKEFRQRLEADRQSKANNPDTHPSTPTSNASSSSESRIEARHLYPGSDHEANLLYIDPSSSSSNGLSSLIYGTREAHLHDHEIQRSFSQLLARGKYVHSIVFHQVKPDKVAEYVDAIGQWYPHVASIEENKVNLVGSWRTEVGDNDTFGAIHSQPWRSP